MGNELARYRVFGVTLESDFPFENRLEPTTAEAELTFECVTAPPPVSLEGKTPFYESPYERPDGLREVYVYAHERCDVVVYPEQAHYYVSDEHIRCHLLDDAYAFAVEIWLLGTVLSYWLERRGMPALHASAVSIGGRAVAFLASNKGGKSSLAAGLMRLGYPLLSDDIVPVEGVAGRFMARPGYPQMRMWLDQAGHFVKNAESLSKVHPNLSKRRIPVGPDGLGSFCAQPQPLTAFIVPERGTDLDEIRLERVNTGEALLTLIEHSFLIGVVEAAGWEVARFKTFAALLAQAPLYRLHYPEGMDRLDETCRALAARLQTHR